MELSDEVPRRNGSWLTPRPFLKSLLGRRVAVRLKWGLEYRGRLSSFDDYFNLHLEDAEEWEEGLPPAVLGEMTIRCNNVLYVRELSE